MTNRVQITPKHKGYINLWLFVTESNKIKSSYKVFFFSDICYDRHNGNEDNAICIIKVMTNRDFFVTQKSF